jgi:hypothetical protein
VLRISFLAHRDWRIKTKKPYTERVNTGGNFCGHSPNAPVFQGLFDRLIKVTPHPLLKAALKRLRAYYSNPSLYEKLGTILANGDPRSRRRDGKPCQFRSDGRDGALMVMGYLLSQVNLMRLQVGVVPYSDPDGLYDAPTAEDIAQACGMSKIRVQRHLLRWKHGGYLTVTPRRRQRPDGQWESLPPVVAVHRTVFTLIGVTKEALKAAAQFQWKKYKAEREKRFKKAVTKEKDLHAAKVEESRDFFTQELLKKVGDLPSMQKAWKDRHRQGPPNKPGPQGRPH